MISAIENKKSMIQADSDALKKTLSIALEDLKVLEDAKAIQDEILSPIIEEGKTASTLEIELEAEKSVSSFFGKGSKDSKALAIKKEQILDYLRSEIESNEDFEDIINIQELFEYVKISVKAFELIREEREELSTEEITAPQLSRSSYIREMIMAFIVRITKVVSLNDSSKLHAILREEIASKGIRVSDLQKQKADLESSILAIENDLDNNLQQLGVKITDTLVVSRMMTSVEQYDMGRIGDAYFREFYHSVTETGINGFFRTIMGFFTSSIFRKSFQSKDSPVFENEKLHSKPSTVTAAKKSSNTVPVKLDSRAEKAKKDKKEAPLLKLKKLV